MSDNSLDKLTVLDSMGASYLKRFVTLGQEEDLNQAISCINQAISLSPSGHPRKAGFLSSLGLAYYERFQFLGELVDVDMAISLQNEAALLVPDTDRKRPGVLDSLGIAHQIRFQRLEDLQDIHKAVDYHSQAALLTPDDHNKKSIRLEHLGCAYETRFQVLGHLDDIQKAILYQEMAATLTPDNHSLKPEILNSLGGSYYARFERLQNLDDLNTAITLLVQAVDLAPDGRADKHSIINTLGCAYHHRYLYTGEREDLELAICHIHQAIPLAPHHHPSQPGKLLNLANAYSLRSKYSGEIADVNRIISCCREAIEASGNGDLVIKLAAARLWVTTSRLNGLDLELEAYMHMMDTIPRLVWLGTSVERRYEKAVDLGDQVIGAVNAAIKRGLYNQALEWLEQGRSVVWNQFAQLRTPFDELAAADPLLAKALKDIARGLDHESSLSVGNLPAALNQEHLAQRRRRLAEDWEQAIARARLVPGFHDFLRPMKKSQLMAAARSSIIVVVVVHIVSCDALIIRPDSLEVTHIPLTEFSLQKVVDFHTQLIQLLRGEGRCVRGVTNKTNKYSTKVTMELLLKELWMDVARPIPDARELTAASPEEELPHITWCPTGPLAFLPLHAAGDYDNPGCTLFDRVISSYAPNLSSLLVPPINQTTTSSLAAIGQSTAQGFTLLPNTRLELDQIEQFTNSFMSFTRLEGESATSMAALDAMEQHSWVHLACHASQNPMQPTASAFHLHDGPLDLATITRKQLKHADLAFLSACQTATGDHALPEEAVHLAAGMIMAGYRRVIATMWSIEDKDAPFVAGKFYAYMLDQNQPSENKAARALHYAVRSLHQNIGVGEFSRWAPYIHIGL
ncbi:hypothetical protein FRC12_002774 [Ceratobasidium sp. 428]|nr:hypothetical protein FRC12_002774 [Ceratobasidium sp. 428]